MQPSDYSPVQITVLEQKHGEKPIGPVLVTNSITVKGCTKRNTRNVCNTASWMGEKPTNIGKPMSRRIRPLTGAKPVFEWEA